jgi:hypothetical protein
MGAGASTQKRPPTEAANGAASGASGSKPSGGKAAPNAAPEGRTAGSKRLSAKEKGKEAADADDSSDDDSPAHDEDDAADPMAPILPAVDPFTREFKHVFAKSPIPGVSVLDMQRAVALSNELHGEAVAACTIACALAVVEMRLQLTRSSSR